MTHLSLEDLRRWRDAPSDADRLTVVGHLAVCDACADRYAELVRTREATDEPSLPVAEFVARGLELSTARAEPAATAWPWTARFALAAAVLLALGVSWQMFESRRLRLEVSALEAERQSREQEMAQQAGSERTRSEQLDRELQEERRTRAALEQELAAQREPRAPDRAASVPVVSLFLTAGRVRAAGETKSVTVPAGEAQVRLVLDLGEKRAYRSYEAEIVNAQGASVWSRRGLPAEQLVIVTVPAKALPEDDYEIGLRGITTSGASERVGEYAFTVLKK